MNDTKDLDILNRSATVPPLVAKSLKRLIDYFLHNPSLDDVLLDLAIVQDWLNTHGERRGGRER